MPNDGPSRSPARVLVIGYGPSGITAVEQFQEHGFQVTCLEARSEPGGIWNHEPGPEALEMSFDAEGRPVMQSHSESKKSKSPALSSAMYDCLHTNLPNPLMGANFLGGSSPSLEADLERSGAAYRGHPFPTKLDLFPSRAVVADYLADVAKPRESCVQYNTLVTRCRHNPDQSGLRWSVQYQNLESGQSHTGTFDYVVAASGHYSVPFVPYHDGLWLWKRGVSHGRSYRSPDVLKGKNVLVVGARTSGYDITRDISDYLYETEGQKRKIYQSVRDPANMFLKVEGPAAAIVHQVTAIRSFSEESITLTDGAILTDVDHVLFATGYLFSFPYFNMEDEPFKSNPLYQTPSLAKSATAQPAPDGNATYPSGGLAIHNLEALNIFYYPDPTLAFPAIQYLVVPMQLAQTQARYVAHKWAQGDLQPEPGPDAKAESGWASDDEVRSGIYLGGEEQFDYEDALLRDIGEGGPSTVHNGDKHEDGSFADNPKWRRCLRLTANVLKKATLGY